MELRAFSVTSRYSPRSIGCRQIRCRNTMKRKHYVYAYILQTISSNIFSRQSARCAQVFIPFRAHANQNRDKFQSARWVCSLQTAVEMRLCYHKLSFWQIPYVERTRCTLYVLFPLCCVLFRSGLKNLVT